MKLDNNSATESGNADKRNGRSGVKVSQREHLDSEVPFVKDCENDRSVSNDIEIDN